MPKRSKYPRLPERVIHPRMDLINTPQSAMPPDDYHVGLRRDWRSYIVGPDLEVAPFWDGKHSVDCGVYFLFASDCRLLYIGQSLGIQYRVTQHHWAGRKCDTYGAVAVPVELLPAVEIAYIHALKPPLNRKLNRPPYDSHDEMVKAILELWEPCAP